MQRYLELQLSRLPTRLLSDGTCTAEQRLGALGDLQLALDRLGCREDLLVAATDKLLAFELAGPLQFARQRAAPVNVCVQAPSRDHLAGRHGCVLLDPTGRIVDFEEKPRRPKSRLASLAIYVLPAAAQPLVREYLQQGGNPDAPGYFLGWLTRRTAVYGYVADGPSYDVGTPAAYAARATFLPRPGVATTSAPHHSEQSRNDGAGPLSTLVEVDRNCITGVGLRPARSRRLQQRHALREVIQGVNLPFCSPRLRIAPRPGSPHGIRSTPHRPHRPVTVPSVALPGLW